MTAKTKRGIVEVPKLTLTAEIDGYKPQIYEPQKPKPEEKGCEVPNCPYNGGNQQPYYASRATAHSHYQFGDLDYAVMYGETIIESYTGVVYKYLGPKMESTAGGSPLQWEFGKWNVPDGKVLATCKTGLHALLPGQHGFNGSRLFVAEAEGPVIVSTQANKIITGKLRVLREVDQTATPNDQAKAAAWKQLREGFLTTQKDRYGGYPHQRLAPRLQPLIKTTPEATVSGIKRLAKPLLKELTAARSIMLDYEQDAYPELGLPGHSSWDKFHEAARVRKGLRRKLNEYNSIVYQIKHMVPHAYKGHTEGFDMSDDYRAFLEAEFEMPKGGA